MKTATALPIFKNEKNEAIKKLDQLLNDGFVFFCGYILVGEEEGITFKFQDINECHYIVLHKGAVHFSLYWDGSASVEIRSSDFDKLIATSKEW